MSILILCHAKLKDLLDAYRKFTKLLLTKNFSLCDDLGVEVGLHEVHIEILHELQEVLTITSQNLGAVICLSETKLSICATHLK